MIYIYVYHIVFFETLSPFVVYRLCSQARDHFEFLRKSSRWCGAQGCGILLQEYLLGTEYIIDHVSCDGVHKTTMLWMYDSQVVNGSRVCVAQQPISSDTFIGKELIEYTRNCLDALCVCNGASHTEVMWTSSGPCLVEVRRELRSKVGEDKIGRSTTFSKGSPSRTGELSLPRWHWLLGAVVPKDDRLQPNGCMH